MGDWWLRSVLVLQSPTAVFAAVRRDGTDDLADRSEPVLAIVLLSGVAFALATPTAAHLMDDADYDALLVCVWAFLAGAISGGFAYWLLGAVLHGSVRALGSHGSFRRSRHLLAFAAVPIVCSLVLWPVKLSLYGEKLFRAGGAGIGQGGTVFSVLGLLFVLWAAGLLVVGVRTVHGWSWGRAALAAAAPALVAAVLLLI
jgi:hypothetical protein